MVRCRVMGGERGGKGKAKGNYKSFKAEPKDYSSEFFCRVSLSPFLSSPFPSRRLHLSASIRICAAIIHGLQWLSSEARRVLRRGDEVGPVLC